MGRSAVINGRIQTPPPGAVGRPDGPDREPRDPWTPSSGRDLLAGIAVISVLLAILVVYTHDVPQAPRPASADPVPWAKMSAAKAPADWTAVPVTQRLSDLDPAFARPVGEKLARSRSAIARCLADTDGVESTAGDDAEVVLRLAPRSTALHVEGVEAGGPGTPPEIVECARHVLDGDAIPASGVVPGKRYRVRVTLR